MVFEQKGTFPESRAKLYEDGLDALLDKWDASRGVERDQLPYKNLSLKQRKDLLSQIAYPTFNGSRYFFEPEDVEEYITQYYNSSNIKDDIEMEKLLKSIEAQHGLLIERARSIYSFSHLTFHEYFTARNIVINTTDTDNKLLLQLSTYINKRRWREVFILTAGLMRNKADQLLLVMEEKVRSYINTPKLKALLHWADKETVGSASDIEPYRKRALAIAEVNANTYAYAIANAKAYAINLVNAKAYANVIANAYTIADINANVYAYADTNTVADTNANVYAYANTNPNAYAYAIIQAYAINIANAHSKADAINEFIQYARKLEENLQIFNNINYTALIDQMKALKYQIPNDEQPEPVRMSFTNLLMETWLHAFNLTLEMVHLSDEEIEALKIYLYANCFIIECKKAAVKVAPSTWKAIEDRMWKID